MGCVRAISFLVLCEHFSENKLFLRSLKPKARRMHRGPREGGVSKKTARKSSGKQSARRADMIFADRVPQPLAHFPMAALLQAQQQSQMQRNKVLDWVS